MTHSSNRRSSSAAQDASPVEAAPCTITHFAEPSFDIVCTVYDSTSTATAYTACGGRGCSIETVYLGVGLPCRTFTTTAAVATKTVMACKRDANGRL